MSALECLIHTVLLGILVVFEVIQRQVPAMTFVPSHRTTGSNDATVFRPVLRKCLFPPLGFPLWRIVPATHDLRSSRPAAQPQ